MKVLVCCFVALMIVCLCDPTKAIPSERVKRQLQFGDPDDGDSVPTRPPRPTRPSRPTRPTPSPLTTSPANNDEVTTSSPQFLACVERCQVTPQYNPVCGTNMVTYPNEGRLLCARRCGLNITVGSRAACAS